MWMVDWCVLHEQQLHFRKNLYEMSTSGMTENDRHEKTEQKNRDIKLADVKITDQKGRHEKASLKTADPSRVARIYDTF